MSDIATMAQADTEAAEPLTPDLNSPPGKMRVFRQE